MRSKENAVEANEREMALKTSNKEPQKVDQEVYGTKTGGLAIKIRQARIESERAGLLRRTN